MSKVNISISGVVGSGKTALYAIIVKALEEHGVPVIHEDPKDWGCEVNAGALDTIGVYLDMYKPVVTLAEVIVHQTPRDPS